MSEEIMRKILISAITLLCLLLSSMASAAVINQWTYSIEGVFSSYYNNVGTGIDGIDADGFQTLPYEYESGSSTPGASATGATYLEWGDPAYGWPYNADGPSSLKIVDIESTAMAQVTTNGPAVNGLSFLHNNQPVYEETLAGGTVRAVLSITPNGGTLLGPFSTVLDFEFIETSNNADPQSNPANSDLFILAAASIPNTIEDFLRYDGYIYTLDFNSNLQVLAGLTGNYAQYNGRYGWKTTEDASTLITTLFSIKSRPAPVPEPSTVLLLGAGILGLSAMGRRRS
jgi:hypothetical protein